MPALSDNSRGLQRNPNEKVHIPFKAVYRLTPVRNGRRSVEIRDLEKQANYAEYDLTTAGWNIATPIRFIPQFGNKPARIEITGFTDAVRTELHPNVATTSLVKRLNTGVIPGDKTEAIEGQPGGGNLSFSQEPTARMENDVLGLIANLAADSDILTGLELEFIDYNGIKYGRNGRTFPQ